MTIGVAVEVFGPRCQKHSEDIFFKAFKTLASISNSILIPQHCSTYVFS